MSGSLPDARWGDADSPLPDWRKSKDLDDTPDDDEQLAETPQDVIDMLGFDPAKEEADEPPPVEKRADSDSVNLKPVFKVLQRILERVNKLEG